MATKLALKLVKFLLQMAVTALFTVAVVYIGWLLFLAWVFGYQYFWPFLALYLLSIWGILWLKQ